MSFNSQLIETTIRIQNTTKANECMLGTGFFVSLKAESNQLCHLIITNRHVVENAATIRLFCSFGDEKGERTDEPPTYMDVPNPEALLIYPEDPTIDLAVLLFSPIFNVIKRESGKRIHFKSIPEDFFLKEDNAAELSAIQDVLMIGYPNGLWDEINNLPIARRGISATPIFASHNGKNEFLVDCACFPGSSGSPIITFNQGIYQNGDELEIKPDSFKLAGILYAGPISETDAEITERNVDLTRIPFAKIRSPIHLGYCIRSTEILNMKSLLIRRGVKLLT